MITYLSGLDHFRSLLLMTISRNTMGILKPTIEQKAKLDRTRVFCFGVFCIHVLL